MLDEFKNVMKQEDKKLLLKDLCARLPYGVKCEVKYYDDAWELLAIYTNGTTYAARDIGYPIETYFEDCKPYLFPLSSMTQEIMDEIYNNAGVYDIDMDSSVHIEVGTTFEDLTKISDILHKHHIDYRGLIPKGLANDATNKNIY